MSEPNINTSFTVAEPVFFVRLPSEDMPKLFPSDAPERAFLSAYNPPPPTSKEVGISFLEPHPGPANSFHLFEEHFISKFTNLFRQPFPKLFVSCDAQRDKAFLSFCLYASHTRTLEVPFLSNSADSWTAFEKLCTQNYVLTSKSLENGKPVIKESVFSLGLREPFDMLSPSLLFATMHTLVQVEDEQPNVLQ